MAKRRLPCDAYRGGNSVIGRLLVELAQWPAVDTRPNDG